MTKEIIKVNPRKPAKSARTKPAEKPENKARRLLRAQRRQQRIEDRSWRGSACRRRDKQQARTAVYRIIYGKADTGLGVNIPAIDCRKRKPMSPTEYREAGYELPRLLRQGKFTSQQIAVLNSRFAALAPRNAEAAFDFGPDLAVDYAAPTSLPTSLALDPSINIVAGPIFTLSDAIEAFEGVSPTGRFYGPPETQELRPRNAPQNVVTHVDLSSVEDRTIGELIDAGHTGKVLTDLTREKPKKRTRAGKMKELALGYGATPQEAETMVAPKKRGRPKKAPVETTA